MAVPFARQGGSAAKNSRIRIAVKGATLIVENRCSGNGPRRFSVNGEEVVPEYDEFLRAEKIFLPTERLAGEIRIIVTG